MSEDKKSDMGKKAVTTTLAVFTAAGLAVSNAVDSPTELLEDGSGVGPGTSPVATTHVIAPAPDLDGDDGDEDADEMKKRPRARAKLRETILALPLGVRMVVILPLWLLGSGVTWLGGFLLSGLWSVAAPVAALAAGFTAAAKAIFPDLPLKKILNRKTIPWLMQGALFLVILDGVLSVAWEDYGQYKHLSLCLALLPVLGALVRRFVRKELERRRALPLPGHEEEEPDELLFEDGAGHFFKVRTKKEE